MSDTQFNPQLLKCRHTTYLSSGHLHPKKKICKLRIKDEIKFNIYTFHRDTQCICTDCLLILRCQLYMFRTVTVHP